MKKWVEQFRVRKQSAVVSDENLALIEEIQQARERWTVANEQLNYVMEQDQIDYAIYALEAAEKKYDMLLRQAKKQKLNVLNEMSREVMEETGS